MSGECSLGISFLGYKDIDRDIEVKGNTDLGVIVLEENPVSLDKVVVTANMVKRFADRKAYKAINIRGPYFVTKKPVYELQVCWPHKSWDIEALVRNPFSRYYKEHIAMDYGCYNQNTWTFSEPNGGNVALKLTYSFCYGKKTKRGDITVEKSTKDAILKGD